MKKLRIYLDTSVINFLFADDAPEKKEITRLFFDKYVLLGLYDVYISDVVLAEIRATTDRKKRTQLLDVLTTYPIEYVTEQTSPAIDFLTRTYLEKNLIPKKNVVDALHVALATVNEIDVLLTWNYKHLANVVRERKIIAENFFHNYWHNLRIVTPMELISDEE